MTPQTKPQTQRKTQRQGGLRDGRRSLGAFDQVLELDLALGALVQALDDDARRGALVGGRKTTSTWFKRWRLSTGKPGLAEKLQHVRRPEFINIATHSGATIVRSEAQTASSIDEHFAVHLAWRRCWSQFMRANERSRKS